MNNCEIEIDFLRQSFRVLRKPDLFLKESNSNKLSHSPTKGDHQRSYNKSCLPLKGSSDITKTPPLRKHNTVDKVRTVKRYSVTGNRQDIAAGGIFTSVHVPLKPDNNFERIYNQMLPDDDASKGRCFCHKRPRSDVDVNKIMQDLMKDMCKSFSPGLAESPQTRKNQQVAWKKPFFKSHSVLSILKESIYWIGTEYRYNAQMDTLSLKFVLIGRRPDNVPRLHLDVRIPSRNKNKVRRVNLKASGTDANLMVNEITVPMISYMDTLAVKVHAQLEAKIGFLRLPRNIDEWVIPLDDCHCMYQRSYWRSIKKAEDRN